MVGLPGIVTWLQTFGARTDSKEPPTDLLSFLKSTHVTVAKLKLESTYRGIKISSSERKSAIADAVYEHVLSNLDGYVNQDKEHPQRHMPWQPCGFTGPKPMGAHQMNESN